MLVTLPAAGGEATRSVSLDRDLRDVVVENGNLWVSVFRSSDVLLLDAEGGVATRYRPPQLKNPELGTEPVSEARVAWRMVADPVGGVSGRAPVVGAGRAAGSSATAPTGCAAVAPTSAPPRTRG